MGHRLKFYTKDGCHLCDEARGVLARLMGELDIVIEEIEITKDATLYERYKDLIPVVIINDEVFLVSRISEPRLREALSKKV